LANIRSVKAHFRAYFDLSTYGWVRRTGTVNTPWRLLGGYFLEPRLNEAAGRRTLRVRGFEQLS
jgi:hypothetical protein